MPAQKIALIDLVLLLSIMTKSEKSHILCKNGLEVEVYLRLISLEMDYI